jgi:ATP-dependent Clp protease ATP-binding subunit ClpA
MDHGKLTDNNGKPADFRHVILIMTSNVGARELARSKIGFGDSENFGADESAYKTLFAPEFRNRLDARVQFDALKPEAMERIVEKFLRELEVQLADRSITLEATAAAKKWLGDKGYDKVMGARPLQRVIRDEVKKPLTEEILFGALASGGHCIIDLDESAELRHGYEGQGPKTGRLVFRFDASRAIEKAIEKATATPA